MICKNYSQEYSMSEARLSDFARLPSDSISHILARKMNNRIRFGQRTNELQKSIRMIAKVNIMVIFLFMTTGHLVMGQMSASMTTTNVDCNGECTGSVDLTVAGGQTPYAYSWDNGVTNEDLNNLCAGVYSVVISDINGGVLSMTATITEPSPITASMTANGAPCDSCQLITTFISGGTPNYYYIWDNDWEKTTATVELCEGTHTLEITDANGCVEIETLVIQAGGISVDIIATPSNTCQPCDGALTANISGGSGPFTFQWSDGGNLQVIQGVCSGTYIVEVTDANGCSSSDTITYVDPYPMIVSASTTDASCGQCDGEAYVSVTGGIPQYSYQWDDMLFQSAQVAYSLCSGNYTYTVTDANGCIETGIATIIDAGTPSVAMTVSSPLCLGDPTGMICATASGGSAPYQYNWTPGGGTDICATGLPAGTYCVNVTDITGCTTQECITLTEPSGINLDVSVSQNTDSSCNGIAVANASGGVAGYSYLWSPSGAVTSVAGDLCPGDHTVCVTDMNGCMECATVTIGNPSGIEENAWMKDIIIYPNPVEYGVYVHNRSSVDIMTVSIHNVVGKLLKEMPVGGNVSQIDFDLGDLIPGVYFIEVMSHEGSVVRKIQKL